ncbi:fluoride efflux transporter CrcB [Qipengyuania nanhaisediminis]|uniref:fluoride efflux transporter CrcB n=1 Tax=Qipengyuania nanhaisediminis TaxID=604088 RepID=UPI0038B24CF7
MATSLTPSLAPTLAVALGGAAGAVLRYHAGLAAARIAGPASAFPWGTLAVNVIGSIAMGALMGWLARHGEGHETLRLALGVGLLGGFTTFSAFSAELVVMLQRGQVLVAVGYGAISIAAGMAGLLIAFAALEGAR